MERPAKRLTLEFILGYFGVETNTSPRAYGYFVDALTGNDYQSPLKKVTASTILGGLDFIKEIKDKYLNSRTINRDVPALAELKKAEMTEIDQTVKEVLEGDINLIKKASIYICHRYSGRTLKEIGGYFQIGESGVTKASQRFHELLKNDREMKKKVEYICNSLRLSNA